MIYEAFIAWRYLSAKRRERFISIITLICVGGVCLGVMTLIIVLGVMAGFQRDLQQKILGTNAHIVILGRGSGISNYPSIIEKVQGLEVGVVACAPFIEGQGILSSEYESIGVNIRGIQPDLAIQVTELKEYIEEGSLPINQEVLIGIELAKRLGVVVGDQLMVLSPGRGFFLTMPQFCEFRVGGIFSSGMYDYDASLAFISLKEAQALFGYGEKVTGIAIKVDDLYRADLIARQIQESIDAKFLVLSFQDLNKNLFSALKLEKTVMFIILILIICVAVFGIASSLIMTVMQRTQEIGILKSMGATPFSIRLIFTLQGLFIGILGTTLGCIGGVTGCILLSEYQIIKLPADVYYISSIPVHIQMGDIVLISLCSLLLSLLSTLYPAGYAAKLDPVEALRYE